jgi:hypothetical protein
MEKPNVSSPVAGALAPSRGTSPNRISVSIWVGVLGTLLVVFIVMWMGRGRSPAGASETAPTLDTRYLPDDASTVVTIKIEEALSSPAGQSVIEQITGAERNAKAKFDQVAAQVGGQPAPAPEPVKTAQEELAEDFRREFGLELNNVVQLTIALKDSGRPVQIVRIKKPVTAEEIDKLIPRNLFRTVGGEAPPSEARKTSVGALTIYEVPGMSGTSFAIAEKVVIYGRTDALKAILERNGDARLSAELTEALGHADFSKTIAVAAVTPKKALGPDWLGETALPEAAAISIEFTDKIALSLHARFKDAKNAADVKTAFERALAEGQKSGSAGITKFAEAVKVNQLTATATIAADSVVELVRKFTSRTTNTFESVGTIARPAAPPQQK